MEKGAIKFEGSGDIRRAGDGSYVQAFVSRRVEFGKCYVALYERRPGGRLLRVLPREAVDVSFSSIAEVTE